MFSSTARIAMLQARRFHKTALKPTFTNATASEMKEGRTRYHDTHDLIECKQSPTTPSDTSARAAWQRYRDVEAHQIWLSSPRKESFQTKFSTKHPDHPEPTPAMTFRKDREMHIAARRASDTGMEGKINPDRKLVGTRLGYTKETKETKSLRSRWLDALLGGGERT